ncbi:unnamed protein product [Tenebrio molitor]|nr:unnamed protein product [Tenebrio molitor]
MLELFSKLSRSKLTELFTVVRVISHYTKKIKITKYLLHMPRTLFAKNIFHLTLPKKFMYLRCWIL